MSDLYLRSVELSNFRIYGDSYAYDFPGGPGVTLITGANGLGKTSFFDGVEWALTNQVSRFQDIPIDGRRREPDPLTRIGAPADSQRVSLQFSDGAPIDRGAGFVPSEAGIAELLKKPNWDEISNLHGYLSITHFLGQAATQRFSLRKPREHWEALRGPAGIDRINALRERMSGQGARQAFTRSIKDRTQRLEGASDALLAWTDLIADRDRSRQLASSEEVIGPSELIEAIEQLAGEILILAPQATWTRASISDAPEGNLSRLASLLRSVEELSRDDAQRLESLAQLVSGFEAVRSETAALSKMAEDIEARRATTVEKLASADSRVAEASAALASTERVASQEQHRSVVLARVAAATRQLAEAQAQHASSREQLDRSDLAVGVAQSRIEQLRDQLGEATARRGERRGLAEQMTQARKRAQISVSLTNVRTEIARLSPLAAIEDAAGLRNSRSSLAREAKAVADEISRLTSDLRRHDERVQALSEAVSTIAHRLGHNDTSCPVCATEFPPGRLVVLARARSSADATPAAGLATALAKARVRAEDIGRSIAKADRDIAEHEQLLAALAAQRAREEDLRQQLVEKGGFSDQIYDESDALRLHHDLNAIDERLSATPTPEQLQASIDEAEAALRAETVKRVSLERGRTLAADGIETARAALLQYPDLWSPAGELLVDLDSEQAAAEEHARTVGEQIAQAQGHLNNARNERDALRESEARDAQVGAATDSRLNALVKERQELTRKWVETGQNGEPDATRLAQHRSRVAERATRLESLRVRQERLVAGFRKWLSDEQLRERERQIATGLETEGVASEAEVTRNLTRRVASAQRALELAQSARERMDRVGSLMQERAEGFTEQVLAPLNATIQRFTRTLMTWSDASIIYRAEHHVTRSELRPGIVMLDADGSMTQLEMNPNFYFSEGQLSALSVSALLAASTTFGWSRWRGLLLDDPLQHNDVIHASAFMDLLRQMVRELGYQIIMSTHDSTEAEFLGRKCRSARIPYHVHELIPRGEDGLVSAAA